MEEVTPTPTPEQQQALDAVSENLSVALAQDSGTGFCEIWAPIASHLPLILTLVRLIPKYGATLAQLLQFLADFANTECKVQPVPPS